MRSPFRPFPEDDQDVPIHEEDSTYVVGDLRSDGELFSRRETVVTGRDGLRTVKSQEVYQADCGHMVGLFNGPGEFAGLCGDCGTATLCYRCAQRRCLRCGIALCSDCLRVHVGVHLCRSCHRRMLLGGVGDLLHRLLTLEF